MNLSDNEKCIFKLNNIGLLSAYTSQTMLFNKISKYFGNVLSINSYRISNYPKSSILFYRGDSWKDAYGEHTSASYLNLPFISFITKFFSLFLKVRKIASKLDSNTNIVFVYSMNSVFMLLALFFKMLKPNVKLVLIIPDHPMHMRSNMSFFIKIFKQLDIFLQKKMLGNFNSFIVFSKYIIDDLGLQNDRIILHEGAIDKSTAISIAEKQLNNYLNDKVIFMYSGVLSSSYKIDVLVEAFENLGEHYELWFTGQGELEKFIAVKASKNSNIKHFGVVDYNKLLDLQSRASVFLNMRDPLSLASKFSFPSKLFEYLCTGKPIISVKMDGIPSEYNPYLDFLYDVEVQSIQNKLQSYSLESYEHKKKIRPDSLRFILDNKTIDSRVNKILEVI